MEEFLVGTFEIDELGVRSRARGTGLARLLLSAITTAPHGRAWLLTWSKAFDTLAFYRHLGWQEPDPLPGSETGVVVFQAPG
ncbi:GNAT family N-acetyltransferase [Streptomyces europaeiscabiei]|uniref:GNAT family N-acetyltransferase n=1 Tax=Streptomyces europaeiscabiei TaxID=146819 RepID=UPI0029B32FE7|nr:GNAT family N-acetyltransferase [Streptomyces europaeiscabiei]MDX2523522.1 GNAT family N-acetyltransferase [Streptomyces europaeiscabiei]